MSGLHKAKQNKVTRSLAVQSLVDLYNSPF